MGFLDKDIEQLDGVSHVERVRLQRQREGRGKPASGAVEEEAPLNQPDDVLQVEMETREHTGCKCCNRCNRRMGMCSMSLCTIGLLLLLLFTIKLLPLLLVAV